MRNTIKLHKDFLPQSTDIGSQTRWFYARANIAKIPGDARYGLIVTKKMFRHAVDRNRAKRLLRDWIRFNEGLLLPDLDYVFIVRAPILTATREEGRAAMKKALKNIKKQYIGKKS